MGPEKVICAVEEIVPMVIEISRWLMTFAVLRPHWLRGSLDHEFAIGKAGAGWSQLDFRRPAQAPATLQDSIVICQESSSVRVCIKVLLQLAVWQRSRNLHER